MNRWSWLLGALLGVLSKACMAETITVAVASNFSRAAAEIGEAFEKNTGHTVRLSASSSGKLFAQISHGAPFDVFLSADRERPQALEERGLAVMGSRMTYAIGRIVLWSVDEAYEGADCQAALKAGRFTTLAIANPRTAPYGAAAEEVLRQFSMNVDALRGRIATGENIAQALQFVASGNASLGFIAAAQLVLPDIPEGTCHWLIPEEMHTPIEQQGVLLSRSSESEAARGFMSFLKSDQVRGIIQAHGYGME